MMTLFTPGATQELRNRQLQEKNYRARGTSNIILHDALSYKLSLPNLKCLFTLLQICRNNLC